MHPIKPSSLIMSETTFPHKTAECPEATSYRCVRNVPGRTSRRLSKSAPMILNRAELRIYCWVLSQNGHLEERGGT